MTRAFLFLFTRTAKNRFLAQGRRLRQPRYLISAVIGVAYFYGIAGRHWVKGYHIASEAQPFTAPAELLEVMGSIFVLCSILFAWCGPTPASPLPYTEAEIQHLFPAPVSRRGLIRWKLLKGQVGVLFSVLLFTLIAAPRIAAGGRMIFFAGAWIAFATMQLHLIGIRMTLHGLGKRGLGWGLRAGLVAGLFLLAIGLAGWWAFEALGALPAMGKWEGGRTLELITGYVRQVLDTWPAWLLTAPGRLLVRPALAPGLTEFLLALPVPLLFLLLNHLWVVRSGVTLEEGAVEAARHLAETKTAMGQGRRRARTIRVTRVPFRLNPLGRPELALLWKNLIAAFRTVGGVRALAIAVGGTLMMSILMVNLTKRVELAAMLGTMCAMLALLIMLMGPAMIRCDFRIDLLHIDLLKSYPLSGRSLLIGSLLTPVMILTVVEWMLLVAFAAMIPASGLEDHTWTGGASVLALTGAILAPPIIASSTLIQNAGFLMVPGWVALGPARTTGVERIGQGLLTSIGQILAMAVGFLPAAIVFGVAWFISSGFFGSVIALPLSALIAAIVLCSECLLGVLLLGAWLDRLDPSREFDTLARQE